MTGRNGSQKTRVLTMGGGDLPGRHVVFQPTPLSLNSVAWSYKGTIEIRTKSKVIGDAGEGAKLTYDENNAKSFEVDR